MRSDLQYREGPGGTKRGTVVKKIVSTVALAYRAISGSTAAAAAAIQGQVDTWRRLRCGVVVSYRYFTDQQSDGGVGIGMAVHYTGIRIDILEPLYS